MNKPPDERRSKPSASNIERYWNCRGSWLLESQVPESERFTTEDAERGTLLHRANETGDVSDLELSEQDLIVRTREIEERIYNQWCEEFGITDAEIFRERRWWLHSDGEDMCSAKLDFTAISKDKKHLLILDLKSGRKAVTPAPRNWQLRTGVVIVAAGHGPLLGARVGIVAPLQRKQPSADYNPQHIADSAYALVKLLSEIESPTAPRTPGMHCEFCPARAICPEAKAKMLEVSALEGLRWSLQTPEQKVKLWDAWKLAQLIGKQIEENVKADVAANPEAFKEWLVKKPNTFVREITNLDGVYAKLEKEIQFSPETFTAMCSMSVGDLVKFVRLTTGKTEKAANLWINTLLAECIEKKERHGSIERVTK